MHGLLLRWYDRHRRELPWRVAGGARGEGGEFPDPYLVLVSELMLQQTQVGTVVGYFQRFISRFPTIEDLAAAEEQEVLRLWQGLGYYARARNLHAAAKRVVAEHGGKIPGNVSALMELPGVGRYTAGAVASMAFGVRAPIVDGNVARVLCRLDRVESDPRETETNRRLWERAEEILPARRCGDFNSALMELGATVCTPRNPRCGECPVRSRCAAFAGGVQDVIPLARKKGKVGLERRWVFAIHRRGRWLIQQRPERGRWGSMWQFVTVEAGEGEGGKGKLVGVKVVKGLGKVRHLLTHRRYEFEAFVGEGETSVERGKWVRWGKLALYPMSKPQLMIARMVGEWVESKAKIHG